jgi:hypothetical protein
MPAAAALQKRASPRQASKPALMPRAVETLELLGELTANPTIRSAARYLKESQASEFNKTMSAPVLESIIENLEALALSHVLPVVIKPALAAATAQVKAMALDMRIHDFAPVTPRIMKIANTNRVKQILIEDPKACPIGDLYTRMGLDTLELSPAFNFYAAWRRDFHGGTVGTVGGDYIVECPKVHVNHRLAGPILNNHHH